MTLLILAAFAAASAQPAAAPAAPADPHAQHKQGMTHDAKDCCCKDKSGKMECCAKHGAGHDAAKGDAKHGEHADHGLSH